ncbi:MAG: beta-ketoacyl synthase chain length factor [Bacteroidetes bacterium]|nr:beta-ketoacyl synthase chain length factor [Bacteroidota bacterium]
MKPVYISSAAALSPQHSFDNEELLPDIVSTDTGKLYVIDTDYSKFINPVAIRRMSRILKIGISTGMRAVQLSNHPINGIITGTGRGSMRDMELFLGDMIKLNEEALNPTYFIQSTYNSVNGWLAMQTKCTGYNQTYVHRGHSLEMALLDAQMLLNETEEPQTYLVGGLDEMTEDYFLVKSKKGYWKKDIPNSLQLLKHNDTPGSIGGEGAAFFTLTNQAENAMCKLAAINIIQNPTEDIIKAAIDKTLADNNINIKDVDVVLCGLSGDNRFDHLYKSVFDNMTAHTTIAAFKHLVGEYDTSTGFAMWLATELFKHQQIPEVIIQKKGIHPDIKNILIVNHYILNSASIILLQL